MLVAISEGVVADDGHPVDDQTHPVIKMVFLVLQAFLCVSLDGVDRCFWLSPWSLWFVEVLEEIGWLAMGVILRGVVA